MSVVSENVESRAQQLRNLIDNLVEIVSANNGSIPQSDAVQEVANRTGLSLSEVPYIVNSAVADNRITADLRSGMIKLVR